MRARARPVRNCLPAVALATLLAFMVWPAVPPVLAVTSSTASPQPSATGATRPPPSLVSRVELDRLKWSPDGNGLAVEATRIDPEGTTVDTLLFDLSVGAITPLAPRPIAFAIDENSRRLVLADRYALWLGPVDRPTALSPLVRLDPTSGDVIRLGWSAAGDSVLVAVRHPTGGFVDFTACAASNGSRRSLGRRQIGRESDSFWRALGATEALAVDPSPLPGLYQSIGENLFFIERTEMDTPGARGQWFFDLHHRDRLDGSERVLARRMAPAALLVAPDSMWLAMPGREYRSDYGGSVRQVLWLTSPDGEEFFSAQIEGVREHRDIVVRALTWFEGRLWFLDDSGLYVVSPGEGRCRKVRLAPPAPFWARTLPEPARVVTCRLPEVHVDSLSALRQCGNLRREGWPAWVAGPPGGPFRVALGAAADEATLRAILMTLPGGPELLRDFPPEWHAAVAEGTPLPYGMARAPGTGREAWLTTAGPPGQRAGELWLTEGHGARRIRLFRASWYELPERSAPPAPGPR